MSENNKGSALLIIALVVVAAGGLGLGAYSIIRVKLWEKIV